MNGEWKMMNYGSYYETVRLAAKGFIKVSTELSFLHFQVTKTRHFFEPDICSFT